MNRQFIYGDALFDKTYYCGYVSDELMAFLGKHSKQKLQEIVHPDDRAFFSDVVDSVISGKLPENFAYVRVLTASDEYRYCRIRIMNHKEDVYALEVIETDNAVSCCVNNLQTIQRLAFFLEKRKEVMFIYDYRLKTLDIFRYENGEPVSLKEDPVYKPIYEEMLGDIMNPSGDSVRFVFEKVYTSSDGKYLAKGHDIVKNAEKNVLVGNICGCEGNTYHKESAADTHDAMTGLFNKPYSLTLARESLKLRDKVSIVMVDVDDFKTINDTYGHVFGDEVIKKLALIIREAVMSRGFAGRFGGDEFFMCLYDLESEQELRAILQGIYYHFKNAFPDKDHLFSLTMGIAEYPRNSENFDMLLKKADRALYIGKFKGKNRYIIYKEHIHGELPENESENGNIVREENSNRIVQLRILKENTDAILSALLGERNKTEVLSEVFGKLMGSYKIEGINVYAGEDYKNIYSFGRLSTPMENASYVKDPEALNQFNELGYVQTAVKYVRNKYVEDFHGYMSKHNIMTSLQILIGSKENIKAVFTFDTENDIGSCSKEEIEDLMVIAHMATRLIL